MPVDVDDLARIGGGIPITKVKEEKPVSKSQQKSNIQTVDDLANIGSGKEIKKKVGSEESTSNTSSDQSTIRLTDEAANDLGTTLGDNTRLPKSNVVPKVQFANLPKRKTVKEQLEDDAKRFVARKEATKKSVDIYNQTYGTKFNADEVTNNPEKAAEFFNLYKERYDKALRPDIRVGGALSISQVAKPPVGLDAALNSYTEAPAAKVIARNELISKGEQNLDLLKNKVVDLTIDEARLKGIPKKQLINNLHKRLDPKGYDARLKAIDERTTLGLSDLVSGGPFLKDNTKDIELLNTEKAPYEFAINESLKRQANDMVTAGALQGNKSLVEGGKSLLAQVRPEDDIYASYPSLNKSRIAAEISKELAAKAGQLKGTEAEGLGVFNKVRGYTGASNIEAFTTEAFKKFYDNPKTRDAALEVAANPNEYLSDASYFGGVEKNIAKPFKELGLSLLDITGVRDKMDRLADTKNEELFPEVTPELKGYVGKIKGAINTTAYLTGMMAIQVPSTTAAANIGLGTKAATRAGTAMAFGIPSFDANLKDADNFLESDGAKAAYATLGSMINTVGGEFLELGKISKFKELQKPLLELSEKITDKNITEGAVKELLDKAKDPYVNALVKYGTNVTKGAAVMSYFTFANGVNKMLFGGNETSTQLVENTGTAFVDGLLGMSVLGGFGAHADLQKEKNTSYKSTIKNLGDNADATRDLFDIAYKKGDYTRPEYNEKVQILNTIISAKSSLDIAEVGTGITLDAGQRSVYVANRTAEGVIKKQLESPLLTEQQKAGYEAQLKRLQTQREDILQGLTFNDNLEPLNEVFDAQKEYRKAYEDFNEGVVENDSEVLKAKQKLETAMADYSNKNKPKDETVSEETSGTESSAEKVSTGEESTSKESIDSGAGDNTGTGSAAGSSKEPVNAESREGGIGEAAGVDKREAELTPQEQTAIEGFKGVEFKGSTKNWTDVLQSETATPQEKKQALSELKEQLSDPNSEIATGEALGKSADLIYDLIDADKKEPTVSEPSTENKNVVFPSTESISEEVKDALKDVESTAKALKEKGSTEFLAILGNIFPKKTVNYKELKSEGGLNFSKYFKNPEAVKNTTLKSAAKIYDFLKNGGDLKNKPIIIDENNNILDGNNRLMAMLGMGVEDIPVAVIPRDLISPKFPNKSPLDNKYISEAYHKAKEDGSNTALVEAVEQAITQKSENIPISPSIEVKEPSGSVVDISSLDKKSLLKKLIEIDAPKELIDNIGKDSKILGYDGATLKDWINSDGYYQWGTNDIHINPLFKPFGANSTIIHETAHLVTQETIQKYLNDDYANLKSTTIDSLDYLNEVLNKVKQNFKGIKSPYGFKNLHEFVAEFVSNESFRNTVARNLSDKKGIVDKILDAIKDFYSSVTGLSIRSNLNAGELSKINKEIESVYENKRDTSKKGQFLPTKQEIKKESENKPIQNEGTPIEPTDIHELAKEKGIDFESNEFMDKSEELTGERHLDKMDNDQLQKVKDYISSQSKIEANGEHNEGDSQQKGSESGEQTTRTKANEGENESGEKDVNNPEGAVKESAAPSTELFEGENAETNKKEFDKLTSEIPNGGEIKKYLSGDTIKKYEEGTELRNNQEIISQELEPALRHGVEVIEKAKEIFGEDYVGKTLDYIERENLNPENKALLYVSLENEMAKQIAINPESLDLKKKQDLVRTKSQAYLRSNSLAINMGRLRKFAEAGYDITLVTDKFFSSKEREQKAEVEKLVQADAETIQKQADENYKLNNLTDAEIAAKVKEGVDTEIAKLYEALPKEKKTAADKAIAALDKVQQKLRNKTYSDVTGITAFIDAGITTMKAAIKAGVKIAEAVEMGIAKIKEKYGKEWAKEDEFRKDVLDGLKSEGAFEKEQQKQAAKEYRVLETERNRQLKKVGELKEKLSELQKGNKPESDKKAVKKDVPEIEDLKQQVKDAEKELNAIEAQSNRINNLETELDRLQNRLPKDVKESMKREVSEKESELKSQIEAEKEVIRKDKKFAKLFTGVDREEKTQSQRLSDAKSKIESDIEVVREEIIRKQKVVSHPKDKLQDDQELSRLREQKKSLERLRDTYLGMDTERYKEEKALDRVKGKLTKEILDINTQINNEEKSYKDKQTASTNPEIEALKKEKESRQSILEALDPTPKQYVENALIEQGFGKTINIKTKNGVEERKVLDWKKLAGAEGSVTKISEAVAKSLEKSGFTPEKLERISDAFIKEYTDLRASVIEKGLNEIAARNKTTVTPDQKSAAKKLAEMYNYGLFDKNLEEYETVLAKTIGVNKLNAENLSEALVLGKAISKLLSSDFQGKRLTESQMRSAIQVIEDKMRYVLHNEANEHGSTALRIADTARTYMDLVQRMTLNSLKQAAENPMSGKLESLFSSIGYSGTIPNVLNKAARKQARQIYKEMVLEKGVNYGDVSSTFVNKGNLEMQLDKMPDNKLLQGVMSTVIGRTTLDAVDSMYKAKITQQKFTYNLIQVLQKDRLIDGAVHKGMSKEDAKKYVAEKLTGQSFKEAQETAKEIIDSVNKDAGKKIFNDSPLFVDRLANDIVTAALVNGQKISAEQVKASYNAAYKAAGRGLGHVANNFISRGISNVSGKLESDINQAVREKEYPKAAMLTYASIFFRNIANPFVGGGTNWIVLKAEKSGLGLLSGLGSMMAKGRKMDLTSEAGMKNLENAMYQNLKMKDKFLRGAIGGAATVVAAIVMAGITNMDEYRKWRNQNKWAAKYLDIITPEIVLASMNKTSKEVLHYFKTTFNKNESFDKGSMAIEAGVAATLDAMSAFGVIKDTDHKTGPKMGKLVGSMFGAPTPWRLIRDGQQIWQGANGEEPYRVDNTKPETFWQAYFKGGMIDYLGHAPKP